MIKRKAHTFFAHPMAAIRSYYEKIQERINVFFLSEDVYKKLPDVIALKIKYRCIFGKRLNLRAPKTFNEKLQWLKLYNRKHKYTLMADKYAAKNYIEKTVGKKYVIPTLAVYDKAEEFAIDNLPDEFVIKCTHDCGSVIMCYDKSKLNVESVKEQLSIKLTLNYFIEGREWVYKNIVPRIIVEPLLKDDTQEDLYDYKFFCFNGKVRCFKIDYQRFSGHLASYFDREGNVLPFGLEKNLSKSEHIPTIPNSLKEMIEIAEMLSKDFPFLRVDFYEVNGKVYCGELTFYPANGFRKFVPEEWDDILGSWIDLPKRKIK